MKGLKGSLNAPVKAMEPDRFQAVVRAHEAFVGGKPGGLRALLRHVRAEGMDCNRKRLSDADFTGSILCRSQFVGADLSRVNFYCANLSGADLRSARLARADLRGASFSGAMLSGANLDEADMRAAVLCVADESGVLRRAGGREGGGLGDTAGMMAQPVDLSNCSLRHANLRGANLKNADLSGSNLEGCQLQGARLDGVNVAGAILTGVDTAPLLGAGADLSGCVTDPTAEAMARLPQIEAQLAALQTWVSTQGKEGGPACLDGYDLRPARGRLSGRLMVGLRARGALGIGLDFSGAQLQGAAFDDADLRSADFTGADLRGASFRGARLGHAVFRGADLGSLALSAGRVRPACFDGAQLDGTGLRIMRPGDGPESDPGFLEELEAMAGEQAHDPPGAAAG